MYKSIPLWRLFVWLIIDSPFIHTRLNQLLIILYTTPEKVGYLLYVVIGFSAIQSLAFHLIGLIPLHLTAPLYVLPALVLGIVVGTTNKEIGRLALQGLYAGIVAVALYDIARVPFAILGVWGDFIPDIGSWALQMENAPAVIGYVWRYIGNGGGMGVAFIMLNLLFELDDEYTKRGIIFGVLVFACLVATLLISTDGQQMLFPITPITFTAGLLGHLIYGYVLGHFLEQHKNSY